jgi:hypothetical protein
MDMGGLDATGGQEDLGMDALLGTSPMGETSGGLQGGIPGQGAPPSAQESSPFKFAGRTWAGGQKEAEAAWNKLYGGYSERQGLLNALKNGNPETLAMLARDPKIAQILGKLGIEAAREKYGAQQRGVPEGAQEMSFEDMRSEFQIERRQNEILRAEMAFERRLGRNLSPKEQDAVYAVLERAGNEISYEEAWFLAHREQLLRQRAQDTSAGGAQGSQAPQQGGRPKPPPRSLPGTPSTGKKSVAEMSEQEWRANLKESGLIKQLLSKHG